MTTFLQHLILFLAMWSQPLSSPLTGKTWAYKELSMVIGKDTIVIYHSDSVKNLWYIGKVSFNFFNDKEYSSTNSLGIGQFGTWSMPNARTLVIDFDTNYVVSLTPNQITTMGDIRYKDSHSDITGKILTRLYVVVPPTAICESLKSGDWQDPYTWSCNRVPMLSDVVVINHTHTIQVTSPTAQAQRIIYNGGDIQYATNQAMVILGATN